LGNLMVGLRWVRFAGGSWRARGWSLPAASLDGRRSAAKFPDGRLGLEPHLAITNLDNHHHHHHRPSESNPRHNAAHPRAPGAALPQTAPHDQGCQQGLLQGHAHGVHGSAHQARWLHRRVGQGADLRLPAAGRVQGVYSSGAWGVEWRDGWIEGRVLTDRNHPAHAVCDPKHAPDVWRVRDQGGAQGSCTVSGAVEGRERVGLSGIFGGGDGFELGQCASCIERGKDTPCRAEAALSPPMEADGIVSWAGVLGRL